MPEPLAYTYLNTVLVAVNPLKVLTNQPHFNDYVDGSFDPERPHPYAIAEVTWHMPLTRLALSTVPKIALSSVFPAQANLGFLRGCLNAFAACSWRTRTCVCPASRSRPPSPSSSAASRARARQRRPRSYFRTSATGPPATASWTSETCACPSAFWTPLPFSRSLATPRRCAITTPRDSVRVFPVLSLLLSAGFALCLALAFILLCVPRQVHFVAVLAAAELHADWRVRDDIPAGKDARVLPDEGRAQLPHFLRPPQRRGGLRLAALPRPQPNGVRGHVVCAVLCACRGRRQKGRGLLHPPPSCSHDIWLTC